jgi:hypothetical protein
MLSFRKIVFGIVSCCFFVFPALCFGPQQTDWAEKWDYRADELHPIRLQTNSIPLVEVKVNGSPLWVIFDTGCSIGFSLTSAVEGKIAHHRQDCKPLDPPG